VGYLSPPFGRSRFGPCPFLTNAANVGSTTVPIIRFQTFDPWEADVSLRLLGDVDVEPKPWPPQNYAIFPPHFIIIDGELYPWP